MKSLSIVVKKLEDKGIKDAEKIVVDVFQGLQEACAATVADPETSAVEKTVAGIAIPVLGGLAPAIEKLADFNRDGHVG